MSWDFVEPSPLGDTSGSFGAGLDTIYSAVNTITNAPLLIGQAVKAHACETLLPDDTGCIWFTDPPYYDNVPYSYLSDFFMFGLSGPLVLFTLTFLELY